MIDERPSSPNAAILAAKRARTLDDGALDTLFREARTARGYLKIPVDRALLERAFHLAFLGPTSANTLPLRIVFVKSAAAKETLIEMLSPGNVGKTRSAPVTAIFAADLRFYKHIPRLSPSLAAMKASFEGDDNAARAAAFAATNATLTGAYFMLAARALGLDVGPMGGFDKEKVDAHFFPDGTRSSLWLANLGYADDTKTMPRSPRLTFDEAATVI